MTEKGNSSAHIAQGVLLSNFRLEIGPLIGSDLTNKEVVDYFSRMKREFQQGFDLIQGILRIRPVTEMDVARFHRTFMRPPRLGQYLVEWEYDDLSEFHREFNLIQKVLLALRLLKQGAVFLENLYSFRRGAKKWGAATVITPPPRNSMAVGIAGGYALYPEEKSDLIGLLKELRPVDFSSDTTFRIACDRFLRYYHEHHHEDRLIDLFIAFEALFRIGPKIRKKGKTIAGKCSELIGQDSHEKNKIAKEIRDGYQLRNAVVHGDEFKENETGEIATLLEDYLRRSIRYRLP